MIEIDLLAYKEFLRIKKEGERRFLFDPIRKSWLVLQPEELVRQLILQYLLREKGYLTTHIRTETGIQIREKQRRCDLVVFDRQVKPFLLIECKAPAVKLDEEVLWQAARYNQAYQVRFLMITNGLTSICCALDYEHGQHRILDEIPAFDS